MPKRIAETKDKAYLDIKSWLDREQPKPKCSTCRHINARTLLQTVLRLAIEGGKKVRQERLRKLLQERYPDYTTRSYAFANHLRQHETDLWEKAKNVVSK